MQCRSALLPGDAVLQLNNLGRINEVSASTCPLFITTGKDYPSSRRQYLWKREWTVASFVRWITGQPMTEQHDTTRWARLVSIFLSRQYIFNAGWYECPSTCMYCAGCTLHRPQRTCGALTSRSSGDEVLVATQATRPSICSFDPRWAPVDGPVPVMN